ncbi:MAG: hypothetical protein B6I32_09000 [Desulfobacterium sp. 4572_20]|nr:MAG: hypothetical protein B6I32_09000 [Desulfobacterium sp. 4572_20]RLB19985.1 MAG: hypothetical protein DRG73_10955 [Deltaproteobacteria bacterium]
MTGNSKMNSYKGIMIALEVKRPDGIPVFPLVRDWAIRQAGFNFILSSGCSIPVIAPPENIEAMVRAAKGA